jgi:clan AA aspartic protease
VRSLEADALVDTGAVSLVLPSFVVEQLGLGRPYKQVAEYADGRREEVDATEAVLVELMKRHTVEDALVLGDEVIIGQTILEKTDLRVDCRQRCLVPNPAHPDQPVLKVKRSSREGASIPVDAATKPIMQDGLERPSYDESSRRVHATIASALLP